MVDPGGLEGEAFPGGGLGLEDSGGLAGVAGDAIADCSCGVPPQAVATASRGATHRGGTPLSRPAAGRSSYATTLHPPDLRTLPGEKP